MNSAIATGSSSSGNLKPFFSRIRPPTPVMPKATAIFSK
jgi:hypothetical protein